MMGKWWENEKKQYHDRGSVNRKYLDKWTIDGAAWSMTCWILVIDGKY